MWHSAATSSRRRPSVRRRGPRGSPTSSGCSDSRRRRRNARQPGPVDHLVSSPLRRLGDRPSYRRGRRRHGSPIPLSAAPMGGSAGPPPRPPARRPWGRSTTTDTSGAPHATHAHRPHRPRPDRPAGRRSPAAATASVCRRPPARGRRRRSRPARPQPGKGEAAVDAIRAHAPAPPSPCRPWTSGRWRRSPTARRRCSTRAADRRPHQQRGRDDPARAPVDRRRPRAAARHEPPRARRPGGAPAAAAACRARPGDLAGERRGEPARRQLGRPRLAGPTTRSAPTATRRSPSASSGSSSTDAAGAGLGDHSNLSHPGVAPTSLLGSRPEIGRDAETREIRVIRRLSALGIAGTAETAALPALLAATSPEAHGGRVLRAARARPPQRPPGGAEALLAGCAAPRTPSGSGSSPRSWPGVSFPADRQARVTG